MELAWTKEHPKIAGWYWWRPVKLPEKRYTEIICVRQGDVDSQFYEEIDNEWAGPIPEPREAGDAG